MKSPARHDFSGQLKWLLLGGIPLAVAVGLWAMGPIAQSVAYHHFADRRPFLGMPNGWDVLSNLPFLLVGLLGLFSLCRGRAPGCLSALRPAYICFFAGTALVGLGSAYYHLAPTNETLVWDRLPMTVAFMAFFSIVVGEHLGANKGARLLVPLLIVGGLSVVYWALTERAGHGDLRPYIFVQFVPLLLVPVILLLFPSALSGSGYFWGVLAAYGVAKALEHWDVPIFHALGGLSGHTLKHLAAALGTFFVWLAVTRRRPVA